MKCVILAAGSMKNLHTRRYGYWPKNAKPKLLYHVRGEVLLERQVMLLRKVGVKDIRIVVGYKRKLVERFVKKKKLKVKLIYCPKSAADSKVGRIKPGDSDSKPYGYLHGMDSIRAGLEGIDDDVIFMPGDVYTTRSDLQQLVKHPDKLAILCCSNCHIFKISKKYLPKLRKFQGRKILLSLYNFIMKEKKVPAKKRTSKYYKEYCIIVKETFDVDGYNRTDEGKKNKKK